MRAGAPTTRSSFPAVATDCGACRPLAELRRPSSSRTVTKGELKFLLPQILPGDGAILFTITHAPFPTWDDDTEVVVQVLASGERKVLVHGGADGRYLPSGHLLYLRKSTLMAVPFDLQQLAATGGAVALIADVMQSVNTPNESSESGAGQFSVSATGSLLYAPGGIFPDPERSLAWVDRNGAAEPLPLSLASVSVAAALTRRPALPRLDAGRPQCLGARSLTRRDHAADIRRQERARHLDAGWHAYHVRIRNCRL